MVHHDFQNKTTPVWKHTGDGTWLRLPSTESVPDQNAFANRVVSSANCDDSCILTLRDTLDTTEPLTISLDRYVDAKIDRDEGLYVEYSVDKGTTWTVLASYTDRNGGNTDRWEKSVIGLSIPQNSAEFRLRAESNMNDERVEVDNLRIFRPAATEPDVSFTAVLNDARTSIAITLSKNMSYTFSISDFELSSGTVLSIQNRQNSTERSLQVTEIPGGTSVTVTYSGPSMDLGDGVILHNGTIAVIPASTNTVPAAPTNLTATSTKNTVTLSWTAPDDNSITRYMILSRIPATQPGFNVLVNNVSSIFTSHVVIGLEARTAYQFAMASINNQGTSTISNIVTISPKNQTVQPPPTNQAPTATMTLSKQRIVVNAIFPMPPVTADCSGSTDPEGDALTYSWSSNPSISGVSGSSSSITFTPSKGPSYTTTVYTITCTVTDGTNTNSSSKILSIYSGGSRGLF